MNVELITTIDEANPHVKDLYDRIKQMQYNGDIITLLSDIDEINKTVEELLKISVFKAYEEFIAIRDALNHLKELIVSINGIG